jgi:hypothetical protein
MRRRDVLMLLGGTLGGFPLLALGRGAAIGAGEFGSWGYDLRGADLATKPGDDFFVIATAPGTIERSFDGTAIRTGSTA